MTTFKNTLPFLAAGLVLGASAFIAKPANATLGMYLHCQGTYNCGMGGAGVAMAQGATSAINNPALGGKMNNTADIAVGWFWADAKGEVADENGNGVANATGAMTSNADNFPTGSMAANYRLSDKMTFNIAIYPGGGGASDFSRARTVSGNSDSNDTNIEFMSLHAQPSVSYKVNNGLTVGGGVVLSYNRLRGDALGRNFARANNPEAWEYFKGAGFHGGLVWEPDDKFSIGIDYRSKIWQEQMQNYNTQFNGAINLPPVTTVGGSYKASPSTTIAMDAKHICWDCVDTIGGLDPQNGGFGWEDQYVFLVGVEHMLTDAIALRAGYTYGNSVIDETNVFGSFLFPAITEHHLNAGAAYTFMDGLTAGFSAYWAPTNSVQDDGTGDIYSQYGKGTRLSMGQAGFQVSLKKDF